MNPRRPIPGSKRVWLIISAAAFTAAWFIHSEGAMPAGMLWWILVTNDYRCSTGELLGALTFFTLIFATAAAVVGWLLQFPVSLALSLLRSRGTKDQGDFA